MNMHIGAGVKTQRVRWTHGVSGDKQIIITCHSVWKRFVH